MGDSLTSSSWSSEAFKLVEVPFSSLRDSLDFGPGFELCVLLQIC